MDGCFGCDRHGCAGGAVLQFFLLRRFVGKLYRMERDSGAARVWKAMPEPNNGAYCLSEPGILPDLYSAPVNSGGGCILGCVYRREYGGAGHRDLCGKFCLDGACVSFDPGDTGGARIDWNEIEQCVFIRIF